MIHEISAIQLKRIPAVHPQPLLSNAVFNSIAKAVWKKKKKRAKVFFARGRICVKKIKSLSKEA